jgi:hypothetical protein
MIDRRHAHFEWNWNGIRCRCRSIQRIRPPGNRNDRYAPSPLHSHMWLMYRINRINRRNPRQQAIYIPSHDPPSEIYYTKRSNRTTIHDNALDTFIPHNGMFLCIRLLGWVD